mgnify:CR=1 FL=1
MASRAEGVVPGLDVCMEGADGAAGGGGGARGGWDDACGGGDQRRASLWEAGCQVGVHLWGHGGLRGCLWGCKAAWQLLMGTLWS